MTFGACMIDDRNRTPHTIADILCITGTGCTTTRGTDITITVVVVVIVVVVSLYKIRSRLLAIFLG